MSRDQQEDDRVVQLFTSAGLDPADTTLPFHDLLVQAAEDVAAAEERLLTLTDLMIGEFQRVKALLSNGRLHPCGILQGVGPGLDVAVTAYCKRIGFWKRLAAAARDTRDTAAASRGGIRS